jgi:hypothetical protein
MGIALRLLICGPVCWNDVTCIAAEPHKIVGLRSCVKSPREGSCGYVAVSFVMLSRSQQSGRREPNSQQYFLIF